MGHERYIAKCHLCDWSTIPLGSKQDAKHERFDHIWSKHRAEKTMKWHKNVPELEVLIP